MVFFVLGGFFVTNAVIAEMTGGKLFQMPALDLGWIRWPGVVLSIGVIPWPVVFLTTDLINEYFGKAGVRRLTLLAIGMISYCFVILFAAMNVPTWEKSPVPHQAFYLVFGQSMWIIVGSLTAFAVSQLVDVFVFAAVKDRTGGRLLWLRATGSTLISQLLDTFIVGFIAFVVPGKLAFVDYLSLAGGNYTYKVLIAILITPLIYLGHAIIDRYLEGDSAHTGPSSS